MQGAGASDSRGDAGGGASGVGPLAANALRPRAGQDRRRLPPLQSKRHPWTVQEVGVQCKENTLDRIHLFVALFFMLL